jgi:hypothetical protein
MTGLWVFSQKSEASSCHVLLLYTQHQATDNKHIYLDDWTKTGLGTVLSCIVMKG